MTFPNGHEPARQRLDAWEFSIGDRPRSQQRKMTPPTRALPTSPTPIATKPTDPPASTTAPLINVYTGLLHLHLRACRHAVLAAFTPSAIWFSHKREGRREEYGRLFGNTIPF